MDDGGIRVLAEDGNFSLHHRVQTGSGAHPASYPMGTRGSFAGSKAGHSPPSSAEVKEWVELYFHSPNTPSWRGAQLKRKAQWQLYFIVSKLALGHNQPLIQWVKGAPSLGVKRPGREGDQSLPSSAEVKNAWSYISTSAIRLDGVVLS
jgi:hypothetical protein